MISKTLQTTIIVAFIMCGFFGIDLHLAAMPAIKAFMHTTKEEMQQSVSLYVLGTAVSLFIYGPLTDKYGRKPIILFGLGLASITSFGAAMTDHIYWFLLMRFLQGFGAGVCAGIGRSVLADMYQGDKLAKIASYAGLAVAVSPLIAPSVGGYLQAYFNWQSVFIVLGCMFLIAGLLLAIFCPETNQHKNPDPIRIGKMFRVYGSILKSPTFIGASLSAAITMSGIILYSTTSSFILQMDYHLTPIQYGWITSAVGIGTMVGRLISSQTIRFFGQRKLVLYGQILIALSGIFLCLLNTFHGITITFLMLAVFVVILAQALAQPSCTALAFSEFHDRRGSAATLYGSCQQFVTFLVSAISAALTFEGVSVIAIGYLLLGTIGILVSWRCFRSYSK